MPNRLVRIERGVIDGDAGKPAVFGTVLSGTPIESCITTYDTGDERFSCGVWRCTVGVVDMTDWPYDEFCTLLSGRVVITPRGGPPQEFRQGDAFVIPKGFSGTWDIRESISKYYAIRRHPGPLARVKQAVRRLLRPARAMAGRRANAVTGSPGL